MPELLAILVRFGLYLDLMLLFGLPLFVLYSPAGGGAPDVSRSLRALYVAAAAAGVLLSALSMALLVASMSGAPVGEIDPGAMSVLISETSIGWAWQARMAALILVVIVALVTSPVRGPGPWLTSLLGGLALGSLAWTGHGAMHEGTAGLAHLVADIVHLLAGGAWLSAILAFGALLFRAQRSMTLPAIRRAHDALARFALVGTITVALLVLTGLVNSWVLVGLVGVPAIASVLYLQLLILKLLLFVGMLGLAALHRFTLTPAIAQAMSGGNSAAALSRIRRSIAVEAALGIAILALVAWFGTLAPPAS